RSRLSISSSIRPGPAISEPLSELSLGPSDFTSWPLGEFLDLDGKFSGLRVLLMSVSNQLKQSLNEYVSSNANNGQSNDHQHQQVSSCGRFFRWRSLFFVRLGVERGHHREVM